MTGRKGTMMLSTQHGMQPTRDLKPARERWRCDARWPCEGFCRIFGTANIADSDYSAAP